MNQKFIFINLSVSHHDCFPRPGKRLIGSPWLFFPAQKSCKSNTRITKHSRKVPATSFSKRLFKQVNCGANTFDNTRWKSKKRQ